MERALTPNGKIGIGVQAVGDGGLVANWPCHPRLRLMMERALIPRDNGGSGDVSGHLRHGRQLSGGELGALLRVHPKSLGARPPPVMSGKIGSGTLQLSAKLETLQLSAELSKSRAIQKKAPAGEEQRALLTGGGRKSGQSPSGTTVFWTVTVLN
jgi:hypothetical protein